VSLRVCVTLGVVASLTAGALCGLAYYAGNLLADSFTTSTPGVPLP
jgi:hypothetical protein